MTYREKNKVLWRGVRPAHNGDQVHKEATATNGTSLIYTVPAGKTLYLTHVHLGAVAIAGSWGMVYYRNVADVYVANLVRGVYVGVTTSPPFTANYYPPLEISAGFDLMVVSNIAGLTLYGDILGWVE